MRVPERLRRGPGVPGVADAHRGDDNGSGIRQHALQRRSRGVVHHDDGHLQRVDVRVLPVPGRDPRRDGLERDHERRGLARLDARGRVRDGHDHDLEFVGHGSGGQFAHGDPAGRLLVRPQLDEGQRDVHRRRRDNEPPSLGGALTWPARAVAPWPIAVPTGGSTELQLPDHRPAKRRRSRTAHRERDDELGSHRRLLLDRRRGGCDGPRVARDPGRAGHLGQPGQPPRRATAARGSSTSRVATASRTTGGRGSSSSISARSRRA